MEWYIKLHHLLSQVMSTFNFMRVTGPGEIKKTCPKGNLCSHKENSWTIQYNLGGRFTKSAHLTPGVSQRFLCWKPNRQDAKSRSSYLVAISWKKKKAMLEQTVLWHEYAKEC